MELVKLYRYLFVLLFSLGFSNFLLGQNDIPERPSPPRLVNDFAGILSSSENQALEQKLLNYEDTTSTQIAVVIVKSIGDYEAADYSQRLGQKWGVGVKGKNNGIVILVAIESRDFLFLQAMAWKESFLMQWQKGFLRKSLSLLFVNNVTMKVLMRLPTSL